MSLRDGADVVSADPAACHQEETARRAVAERQRILAEHARREQEIESSWYAPWQPATSLILGTSRRVAAQMLQRASVFPQAQTACLEVGCGSRGWLGDLITWGVREENLHGIELDARRAGGAQQLLPKADLRIGDATNLPWDDETFHLVIASTVFTSILDGSVRRKVADEIQRVLVPGGALLWYDFVRNNPRNPHVRKVGRTEVRKLFPALNGEMRSVTLAPPLARAVAPVSWILATILEGMPWLRTHLIAVLVKGHSRERRAEL